MKLVPAAREFGLVELRRPGLAQLPRREVDRLNVHVEKMRSAAEVYRNLPRYAAPKDFAAALRILLDSHEQTAS